MDGPSAADDAARASPALALHSSPKKRRRIASSDPTKEWSPDGKDVVDVAVVPVTATRNSPDRHSPRSATRFAAQKWAREEEEEEE
eukprot:COSAG06_NODE_34562_length_473_cov_0.526738_1_plen_85_part_01